MTTYLLDVDVLVSLILPGHESHDRCRKWFLNGGRDSWLTCPLTQNGAIRVGWNPALSGRSFSIKQVAANLQLLLTVGNHRFVSDTVSLLDQNVFKLDELVSPKQTTDTYLLGLCRSLGAEFATMDERIVEKSVILSGAKVHLI